MGHFWLAAWAIGMLAQQPVLSPSAIRQIAALQAEKAARTPVQRKLASVFFAAARMRRGEPVAEGVPTQRVDLDIDPDGDVLVDVTGEVTDALLQRIQAVGGSVVNTVAPYRSARARVPLDALETVAELDEVGFIRPADLPTTNQLSTRRA
jgi:hypothetical protein